MPPAERPSLTGDDLVTGEAVALDLPPASLPLRLLSGALDVLATVLLLAGVLLVLLVAALPGGRAVAWAASVLTLVVVFLVVPTTVETLTRGRSLGKWATGLRAVRDDGGPVTAQHALVRALLGVVEIYALTGTPAVVTAMVSPRGKRLGDYAAGTRVVRERARLHLPPPPRVPPGLAGWAAGADIAALPPGLALACRRYLGRLPQLSPAARVEVGARLAADVSAYVAPPPPPGTPVEDYLAAVVAARRERDAARLSREEALRRRLTSRRSASGW